MGLQLIFVVETNKKCKSDWIYIKETIDKFYQSNQSKVKFSTIYMNGKGNFKKKEKEINDLISQYTKTSKNNSSRVIYCFDLDDYDTKQEDLLFLNTVKQYCKERNFEFVWFCKDIERVYTGRKVNDSQKQKEAVLFKTRKAIRDVNANRLSVLQYRDNTSNILNVLDNYLERK